MAGFFRELYGTREATPRDVVGALLSGGLAVVLGFVVALGGNSGGWGVVAAGTGATLLVISPTAPMRRGRRRARRRADAGA